MQIGTKHIPLYTYESSSIKQIINRLKQPLLQSGKDDLPPDRDYFTKSCSVPKNKFNKISFGKAAEAQTGFDNNAGLLDETARLNALRNIDIPISSMDEYREILKRINTSKGMLDDVPYYRLNPALNNVHRTKEEYLGLLPYTGVKDNSFNINRFLSGRMRDLDKLKLLKDAGEHERNGKVLYAVLYAPENYRVMEDIVRALDYSLGKLDNEYGKYEGIVYRLGFMDTNTGQYFSTSQDPRVIIESTLLIDTKDFSVIRTKSGHKIVDFQKAVGHRAFVDLEQEILLDRKSKYKLLTPEEYDDEILKARELMADFLFKNKNHSDFYSTYTREQFLDLIKVYDEI